MKITKYILFALMSILSMVGLFISHDIKSVLTFGFLYIGAVIQMGHDE
jgi:hypothetical protein